MNMYATYLYIKQHSTTGLKYFGKTTKTNPYSYNGSGTYWLKHIKKHGNNIKTLWVSEPFYDKTKLTEFSLAFSEIFDIVNSNEWANLIQENGLDGSPKGNIISEEIRQKISKKSKNKTVVKDINGNFYKVLSNDPRIISGEFVGINKGILASNETKLKLSKLRLNNKYRLGIPHSPEIKALISKNTSLALKGKPKKQTKCPHCNKVGGAGNMTRYHFANCKSTIISSQY